MHHGADADGRQPADWDTVLPLHILRQIAVAIRQSLPDILLRIGPDAVVQPVLPLMTPLRDRLIVLSDQHRLDAGRSEFNAENSPAALNQFPWFHVHCLPVSIMILTAAPDIPGNPCPRAGSSASAQRSVRFW